MTVRKRATDRCTREKVLSPGRPPAWQREERGRFWQAIALGRSSEEAALDAGASAPLGPRWFREAGGMPPTHMAPWAKPRTGHYLSFLEREDISMTSTIITPDFGALIEFEDSRTQSSFVVTMATLLQCLCIAEEHLLVPPFEAEWAATTIPPVLREWSICRPVGSMENTSPRKKPVGRC